ncbi:MULTISPECIES: capsular polysaccharide synthesis protein [Enterococcus]|uniref:capsular polysaccharide synthesis protein n=1 Tax=Enterococcus TaxID=1350 RepID=UPI0002A46EF3|nr:MULTISPECIES: capsular polysaccharide synthesis protein [Enterococcus]ELA66154.1 hypothetical protein OGK_03036 [Enterococcus faecium EnGen0019]ELA68078.1 hypothetical protein OGM_00595 [Enterococcus faecium EnGen0008]MCD5193333.1 capsular polysaccharide synthesis protein [Enterococcus faecium]MCE3173318.1 capsular polysaccharide synthesis protein [Enterococcus faecium]MCE3175871.1 capsular polysaccharide synthesis protein [Enterococcus faecium]
MNLAEIFKKQGGMKLIRQYWKGGAFFTSIGLFIFLGKSRTALEILRLSASFKTKKNLIRKYGKLLEKFVRDYPDDLEHISSNKVWVCWFQGMDKAPRLVKKCFKSLEDNLTDKEIILITFDNIHDYVKFPDYIMKKWRSGQISNTHMTDLLRLELLIRYGGMWIDATVLCTKKVDDIPSYFYNSDLFFYQFLKPGRDGHSTYISSWLMSARTNNKILMATRYLCYEYWKNNSEMVDYFLLHNFFSIVLEQFPDEWNKIIPRDNATPHILLLRLFETYDEETWISIKEQTPFHKLTYKFSEEQERLEGTYYDVLLK